MAQGLGYGWFNSNAMAMDGLLAMWWQRGDAAVMNGLTATAMNEAMDGLAMDGAMTWQWTAWLQCDSNHWHDSNTTSM
jgi:hypothetical protein